MNFFQYVQNLAKFAGAIRSQVKLPARQTRPFTKRAAPPPPVLPGPKHIPLIHPFQEQLMLCRESVWWNPETTSPQIQLPPTQPLRVSHPPPRRAASMARTSSTESTVSIREIRLRMEEIQRLKSMECDSTLQFYENKYGIWEDLEYFTD
jgi:hypothetical protein